MICASLEYTSCACFLTNTLADATRNTFFYPTRFFEIKFISVSSTDMSMLSGLGLWVAFVKPGA